MTDEEAEKIFDEISGILKETGYKLVDLAAEHSVDPAGVLLVAGARLLSIAQIGHKLTRELERKEEEDDPIGKMIDDALAKAKEDME